MDLGLFYQIQVPKPWDDESETRKFQEMMEQVCFAEEIGMTSVWFVEHHFRSEWSHSSAPDITLAALSQRTTNMRLGIAVVLAPLHHPLNVASRMATLDVISGGRVDLGIGRSGYPYQMLPYGSDLADVSEMVEEYLQIIPGAWTEEMFEFEGKHYQIPPREVIPKPVQKPHPPIWVAARSPITFDYAVENGCNIMSWPLTRPFSEAELYKQRLVESMAAHPDKPRPRFAMMRHTAVYTHSSERKACIDAVVHVLGQFENLFRNLGDVYNGFPRRIPLEELSGREQYDRTMLEENLMFGSPDEVVEKLSRYRELGVDEFIYYASMGLDHDLQKKSLQRFCDRVMPAFA